MRAASSAVVRDDDEARAELPVELDHQLEHLLAFRPSRLPVGSSASTMRGRVTSARATAARCRSPPEAATGRCVEPLAETDALEQPARLARRLRRAPCGAQERHRHVFERGELRQQVVKLVDETHRLVAQPTALGVPSADISRPSISTCPRSAGRARRGSAAASSCPSPRHRRSRRARPGATVEFTPLQHAHRAGPCRNSLTRPSQARTTASVMVSLRPRVAGPRPAAVFAARQAG